MLNRPALRMHVPRMAWSSDSAEVITVRPVMLLWSLMTRRQSAFPMAVSARRNNQPVNHRYESRISTSL
jgi:hypothetical protein